MENQNEITLNDVNLIYVPEMMGGEMVLKMQAVGRDGKPLVFKSLKNNAMGNQAYTPNWADIPKKYKWVGVDRGGSITAFLHQPSIDIRKGVWRLSAEGYDLEVDGDKMILTISSLIFCPAIEPPGKKWRTMLYERPKQ